MNAADVLAEADLTWEGLTPPYGTIVADPPWSYPRGFALGSGHPERWETDDRRMVNSPTPYTSMELDEIKALPVGQLAGPHTRLFLWTTNRYLRDAFDVVDSWGFEYKQTLIWHKTDVNLPSSVAPNSAEFILVAAKGSPDRGSCLSSSVIRTTRKGVHSTKPPAWFDAFEQVSPGPYVELFARAPRLGWDSWGHGYELALLSAEAGDTDG